MQRTPKVFISYAREDSDKVVELRSHLGVRGYSPWMDKFDIIGGKIGNEQSFAPFDSVISFSSARLGIL